MSKRKNIFDLYSNDEKINILLSNLKLNNKIYSKLLESLQLIGKFNKKIEVEFYESNEDDENTKINLFCFDSDDNIYFLCVKSSEKKDLLKITKETDLHTYHYDISLSKDFELNLDNIEFTLTGKVFDFKFGRLITDNSSFYSLFLGNNIGYQIKGDFNIPKNNNVVNELLVCLNKFTEIPKLLDFVGILEDILKKKRIDFGDITISAFKDFKRIGYFTIVAENQKKVLKNQV